MAVFRLIHIFTLWKTCGKLLPRFETVDNYGFLLLGHNVRKMEKVPSTAIFSTYPPKCEKLFHPHCEKAKMGHFEAGNAPSVCEKLFSPRACSWL